MATLTSIQFEFSMVLLPFNQYFHILAIMTSLGRCLFRSFASLLVDQFVWVVLGACLIFQFMPSWMPFQMDTIVSVECNPAACNFSRLYLISGDRNWKQISLVRIYRKSPSWYISCYFWYQSLNCLQSMPSSFKWSSELESDYNLLLIGQGKKIKDRNGKSKGLAVELWTFNCQLRCRQENPKVRWFGFSWHCRKRRKKSNQELLSER